MRGPTPWSIDERELMAAMVAKWNSCPFCVGAHGAVAAKTMERRLVDAVVADYRSAPISEALKAALGFLEIITLRPAELSGDHAKAALRAGVSAQALKDAVAVAALFNIVTRYANALDFAMPSASEFDRTAVILLKRGYSSSHGGARGGYSPPATRAVHWLLRMAMATMAPERNVSAAIARIAAAKTEPIRNDPARHRRGAAHDRGDCGACQTDQRLL
jgi:AhpD family alkylhydroperoxidase